jgi:hypothetical protein
MGPQAPFFWLACVHMYMYHARMKTSLSRKSPSPPASYEVERVQTGVKIEKRLLKVLKGLAEYHDMTLGDLLEGIVLHAFEGKAPFERATLERIAQLKKIYGLDLDARASHRLREKGEP